jgi:hypothetical protein
MRIAIAITMLGALAMLALLAGCSRNPNHAHWSKEDFSYECTVDRVTGVFYSYGSYIRSSRRMIRMYRVTNGERRIFMFPTERVQCAEIIEDNWRSGK